MASPAALLALIVDDDDSIRVLAAWASMALPVAAADDERELTRLVALVGLSASRTQTALGKLRAAGVLVDGGITEMADRMLQTFVQQRLTGGRKGKR